MLNDVRSRHIRKLIIEEVTSDRSVRTVLDFESARRESAIRGLDKQKGIEEDELVFLMSLDEEELKKEVAAK